jgi:predicted kinase
MKRAVVNREPSWIVLVTGPPAGGKTTMARRLATDLQLPLIEKDMLKEVLFDTLGVGDVAWSQRLSGAVYELLYPLLETFVVAGTPIMLECNFVAETARPRFAAIAARHPFSAIEIYCTADAATLRQRFSARAASAERHAGHHDPVLQTASGDHWLRRHPPLALGGPVIEIDTSTPEQVSYAEVLHRVREVWLDSSTGEFQGSEQGTL